ncbi:hypothetical protein FB451DRAFT_1255830 [Mycena latifolia]|nr:hypothetical protein FB451DRAFT_1313131 [Mycena latifolia]KAJ7469139.1 hypothetical protein FB451DRAFT_1255830 [Mycena latifolia]
MKDYLGPNKSFAKYAGRDISQALARYSYREEDINVAGNAGLSTREFETLKEWTSLFLKRFDVVGKLQET